HELLADRAEDALVGGGGEIEQMLALVKTVEGDHEPVDAKRHHAPEVSILSGEIVLAEVRDRIEQLAVVQVETFVLIEDVAGRLFVRGRNDDAVDQIVVDVERCLKRIREKRLAE